MDQDQLRATFLSLATPSGVAELLGVTLRTLNFMLYSPRCSPRYTTFEIPKASGGTRTIKAPCAVLKKTQRALADVLKLVYRPRPSTHGFVATRSVKSNAQPHAGRTFVLNVDLKDFFSTINFGRVRGMFIAAPYHLPEGVATVLAQLCCSDGVLPQGAPTSPIVSNMICRKLDGELLRLADRYRCVYTRYADDLSFSTWLKTFPGALAKKSADLEVGLGRELISAIENNGFQINPKKMRLATKSARQLVTGLTVNRVVNVPRRFTRQIRAMLHAYEKFGLEKTEREYRQKYAGDGAGDASRISFTRVLEGKLAYLRMIKTEFDPGYDNLYTQYLRLKDPNIRRRRFSPRDLLKQALWVIESADDVVESTDGPPVIKQGTAFALKGFGLVTCHHVVANTKLVAYQADAHRRTYPVSVLASDPDLDLAVLTVDAPTPHELTLDADTDLEDHRSVTVAGFPNYAPGKEAHIEHGHITSFQSRHGVRRFQVSCRVVSGNSGGPVLSEKGRVVGIAVTGSSENKTEETDRHSAIPATALQEFLKTLPASPTQESTREPGEPPIPLL